MTEFMIDKRIGALKKKKHSIIVKSQFVLETVDEQPLLGYATANPNLITYLFIYLFNLIYFTFKSKRHLHVWSFVNLHAIACTIISAETQCSFRLNDIFILFIFLQYVVETAETHSCPRSPRSFRRDPIFGACAEYSICIFSQSDLPDLTLSP